METQVKEILKKWGSFVASGDSSSLLNLYDEKSFLKPTLSKSIRTSKKEILSYFNGDGSEKGFLNQGIIQVNFLESFIQATEFGAIAMGRYSFVKKDQTKIEAHYTFVFEQKEDALKIVAHHSSL